MMDVFVRFQWETDGHSSGITEGNLMKGLCTKVWTQLRTPTKNGEAAPRNEGTIFLTLKR